MPDLSDLAADALAREPKRAAVEFEGRWFSWGELRGVADAADRAIPPVAKVAFVARNHPASLAVLLGLIAHRHSIRMLYPFQSAESLGRTLAAVDAQVAIVDARDMSDATIAAVRRAGMAGLVLDGMEIRPIAGTASTKAGDPLGEPDIQILTSGTTGPPKNFSLSFDLINDHYVGKPPWDEDATAALPPGLHYFPLGNISGIYSTLPPLIKGQRVALLERFSIDAWRAYVLRHRPTQSGIPPASMRQFLDANVPKEDLASIKMMGSGAAPLDPALQRVFEERYGIPIMLSYGATEFGGPVCFMTPELHAQFGVAKRGSVGRPGPGVKLRVVDPETDAELATGETGLLHVVSPRMGPDWIITSDLGMFDEDGFLWLKGRADGAIMRGGFKILPETIEQALLAHPAVGEVCVVGVPDERLGQVPAAALCLTESVEIKRLEMHLRNHVLATHIPVHWHICDVLPRTLSFKIDRNAVHAIFT